MTLYFRVAIINNLINVHCVLLVVITKFIILSMCSNPTNKKVHLFITKSILANQPVIIPTYVEYSSIRTFS